MDLSLTSELLYQAGTLTDMQSWPRAQTLWGDQKGNEIPSHEKQDSPCSSSHPAYGQPREAEPGAPCCCWEAGGEVEELGQEGTVPSDATASSSHASWPWSHVMVSSLLTNLLLFLPSYWCRIQANKLCVLLVLQVNYKLPGLKQKSRIYRLQEAKRSS